MTARDRRRGHDAIRSAAWQGAAASGVPDATPTSPPLSSPSTKAGANRRRARRSASLPPPPARRQQIRALSATPAGPPPDTDLAEPGLVKPNGAKQDRDNKYDFAELVGEDEDWRENPSAAARFGERILDLIASGTFDSRDPDTVRESLPIMWLMATLYFRARVDGIENIPNKGPALVVGNHSGGNYIPDSFILGMAFATYFGSERPWYALTHSAAMAIPVIGRTLKAMGSIPATPANADEALRRGACVLVYPGGDIETYRPWNERNVVKFAGRKGYIRTALNNRVPLIPVANVGSHETGIFLSDGQWLVKLLGIDKRFRIKATPIQFALPWGLYATDFLPRLLLPAKIEIRVLPEIEFEHTGPEAAADDDYVTECSERVIEALQEAVTDMASRRRWPIIG